MLPFWSKPGTIGFAIIYSYIVIDFFAFGMLTTESFLLTRNSFHIQLFKSFYMMTFIFPQYNWKQ